MARKNDGHTPDETGVCTGCLHDETVWVNPCPAKKAK
jgi:hypothetical protein